MSTPHLIDVVDRVYLAGKIGKNDWRHRVVVEVGLDPPLDADAEWPVRDLYLPAEGQEAERWFSYVGPYFIRCDHGCAHQDDFHGNAPSGCSGPAFVHDPSVDASADDPVERLRRTVWRRCLTAIDQADVVYAWIDSNDCHGTLIELGFACGLGKPIIIGVADDLADPPWFALQTATMWLRAIDPILGLRRCLARCPILPYHRRTMYTWRQRGIQEASMHTREPIVKIYKDRGKGGNGAFAVTTTAAEPDEFLRECASVLEHVAGVCRFDLEFTFNALLPQVCELWAKLKGYKTERVYERHQLAIGSPNPESEMDYLNDEEPEPEPELK
jgi:hypothetical protein